MARRAWLFDQLEQKFPSSPRLVLDSGNFSDNPTPEGDVKTRALVEAMGRLGYAAANVGDRELSMGYDEFRERTAGAKFPFVSANIVQRDTGEPVFDPYVVVEARSPNRKRRVRVGVIGVTRYNPLFLKAGPDGTNLVIGKPDEMVARYLPEVRSKAEVVVLLAALHKEEARRIIRQVEGIDFVVGSYGGIVTTRDDREGEAWLLYAGNQGKRVGESRVYLDDSGAILSVETNVYTLTARYPSDPPMQQFVNASAAKADRAKASAGAAAPAGGGR